jgi:ubiquinone/menaquinone biosynthesis C-methylase UbiE
MGTHFDPVAFQRYEKAAWERKAAGYHAFYAPISGYVIDALLDSADVQHGTMLLDVGSGPGYVAARAVERGANVIGMDLSEQMVRLAREINPGIQFEVGDAQELAYPSGSFDAVVGNFSLHHMPDQARALQGFTRVLRPGGRVAMTQWDEPARCRFLGVFTDSVRLAGAEAPDDLPTGPPMATSDTAYEDLLTGAGLCAPRVETIVYAHRFAHPEELWNGVLAGSLRTAALITCQPEPVQTRIRKIFDHLIKEYETASGLEVPVSVKLFSAKVPV